MNPDEINARRERRRRFLLRLYQLSEEGVEVYADGYEIAEELGLSREEAERIARYHEDHDFVKKIGSSGLALRISARGIDHVESTLAP
ncbi:MAG: hypothetical protein ACR2H9_08865 [Longimicrobiaceae bacterium]|jgi:CRP-like cAMP-binding protein